MGGRGTDSGVTNQMTLAKQIQIQRMAIIIEESENLRSQVEVIGTGDAGIASSNAYKKCACCEQYTLPAFSEYEECPICGWVDDKFQNENPDSLNGRNAITLNQAKINFKKEIF